MACETKQRLRQEAGDHFRAFVFNTQSELARTDKISLDQFHKKFNQLELREKFLLDKLEYKYGKSHPKKKR